MSDHTLQVLAVIATPTRQSSTRVALTAVAELLRGHGVTVDVVDFLTEPLPLLNLETMRDCPAYAALKPRVERADVILLGTPDYHGCMSGSAKNFLDHFWKEFAGKLFASIVSSYEKGLTVTDQIRTAARQCYAWSLPYGVAFSEKEDLKDGQVINEAFQQRLAMLARDLATYGKLLADQRKHDLAGTDAGFMARYRPKN